MTFLKSLQIPTDDMEFSVMRGEKRTCFSTVYPFKIFPQKEISEFDFAAVTIFYGGNGSGKTTLLNVISEKINAIRHSEFSGSAFFDRYVSLCRIDGYNIPPNSQFLSSDDVFDYVLNIRYLNNGIDNMREELFKGYATMRQRHFEDETYRQLHGLEDYDRWKEVRDATSRSKTQSQFVRERLARNVEMFSNGETAMRYFTEHIDRDAIYLLDEPENSLSIKFQLELAQFLLDSARFYNCQFIISTHSPVFLSIKEALIYNLDTVPVETCNWTELENVRAYFDFFNEHKNEFIR